MSSTLGLLVPVVVALFAAKLGEEIFVRIGQPGIPGQIVAGVVVGPSLLAVVEPSDELELLAEIGVVFVLFRIALETPLRELTAAGTSALGAGVGGVACRWQPAPP